MRYRSYAAERFPWGTLMLVGLYFTTLTAFA